MKYSLASDEAILADLADAVDRMRIRKGLRDADLAAAAGLSRQLISDFRNGKRGITLQSFVRLLRGLGALDELQAAFAENAEFRPSERNRAKNVERVRKREPEPGFFSEGAE